MAYFPSLSVTQNVISDANNSNDDVSQIAAGATWSGSATSTLGVVGIQVSVKTDQNLEIYVDQSPDGINWDITDTIDYWHALGGAGWTFQAVNSYVRVRAKNVGTTTTSYIRLQTVLCPVVEALPRTLDEEGRLQVAVKEISGYLGSEMEISPHGNLRVVIPYRLVGAPFYGTTLDPNFWITTGSTGSGGVTQTGGRAIVNTGGTADSVARLSSIRIARYVAGNANMFRTNISLPTVTGNNLRRGGMYDDNNGFFFEDDFSDGANHVLKLVCRKGGSDTNAVSNGAFNGPHGSTFPLSLNQAYTGEIYVTNKNAYFVINDVLLHTFQGDAAPLTETLALPLRFECINAGGNNNSNTLYVRSASIFRLGSLETQGIYRNIVGATGAGGTVLKYSPGRLQRIIINTTNIAATVALYDNTAASGTLIGTLTLTSSAQGISTPLSLSYDCPFFTGLTVVTTGASSNITVVYE